MQLKLNNSKVLKLALASATTLLFLAPTLGVKALSNSEQNGTKIRDSFLVAQANCPTRRSTVDRTFETPNYYVTICSGDARNSLGYYVGAAKDGSGGITVPLTRRSGDRYIAANGNTIYAITPYELRVSQNGRTILNERILAASGDDTVVTRGCRNRESTFVTAETASYVISICGGNFPGTYIGESKNGSGRIRLPLQRYERDRYVAVNGNTRYILTPNELRVTQNGQTILRETIRNWN
ncbi:hypothetical protein [Floridanema evergladense]|uniref:Uncharacterized protein n=1 Tax=Floridaenema evergladense BLCC-F167 TaxID=3153639 RepID=A0ABV4WF56_9CYAN